MISGDIHSSWFNDLHLEPTDPGSPVIGTEFCSTSISSDFPAQFDSVLKSWNPTNNPQVRYFDGSRHGYLRCELTDATFRTDARTVPTIAVRDAPTTTTASFVTESGAPGLHPA